MRILHAASMATGLVARVMHIDHQIHQLVNTNGGCPICFGSSIFFVRRLTRD